MANHVFEIRVEKDVRLAYRGIQRLLADYKDEKRGPTFIAIQSQQGDSKFNLLPTHRARHTR